MSKNLILGKFVIRLSLQTMFVKGGLVFGLRLDVVSFIDVYGKYIYFKPFIYTVKSCDHISLKMFWIRAFSYYICIIGEQYRYSFIIYGFVLLINLTTFGQQHRRPSSEPGINVVFLVDSFHTIVRNDSGSHLTSFSP
jgi:hypothetical protein